MLAIRDMALSSQAEVYETCLGESRSKRKGCLQHIDAQWMPALLHRVYSLAHSLMPVLLGSRVLDCKGCVSGTSHWDAAVIAGRSAAGIPSGLKVFTDTAAQVVRGQNA